MKYIKLKPIDLKKHPELDEKWLQDIIAKTPAILGIGDVELKDKERKQFRTGRLDLLLYTEDYKRYEVEIQLGATDESHIIRTIEYWDIERKKYPQYEHTAVIIAENITSRFLNVISLFNGHIPLIAIQVTAIETSEGIGLQFTKILDTVKLGYLDDEEEVSELTDRSYWENRATKRTLGLADKIFELSKTISSTIKLSYNKFYIGFWVNGRACNFAACKPQKTTLRLEIKLPKTDETDKTIEDSELNNLDYNQRGRCYILKLTEKDIVDKKEILMSLLKQAYELRQ